jgi:hypothetical protein
VWLYDLDSPGYAPWIRTSTGRLCIDVGATSAAVRTITAAALDAPIADGILLTAGAPHQIATMLMSEMELDDIHTILCYRKMQENDVSLWSGYVPIGRMREAQLDSDFAPSFTEERKIFWSALTLADIRRDDPWMYEDTATGRRTRCASTDVVASGWTRYIAYHREVHQVLNHLAELTCKLSIMVLFRTLPAASITSSEPSNSTVPKMCKSGGFLKQTTSFTRADLLCWVSGCNASSINKYA